MREIDKAAMGQRIKQIRTHVGLRQWELARQLGTTQSAVHKYEHGVVPEPRRLLKLAQIGSTTIEWILTGNHWEDGSAERERLTPDLMRTASLLREIEAAERGSLDEALHILREAVRALHDGREIQKPSAGDSLEDTLRVVDQALRIQKAVLHWVVEATSERLAASALKPKDPGLTPPR
jgi:transcriptional regulator with XRE-family HTH domain